MLYSWCMAMSKKADDVITIVHGSGGALMEDLIKELFINKFSKKQALNGVPLDAMDDGSTIKVHNNEVVITIDSHTVEPIFFPGGNIGTLAISGAVNDVAVMGARPVAILDAVIVEEGFSKDKLREIIKSMDDTAKEVPVAIISGDFKVMPRGKLDRVVITTTGVGIVESGKVILDSGAKPGDKIIVSGHIGEHGVALLSARAGLGFETEIKSDVAPIWDVVEAAISTGDIRAMKDPTRGGLIQALSEIAEKSKVSLFIDEDEIPIRESVIAACEMLGIEPLELINEGCAVIIVKDDDAEEVLSAIKKTKHGKYAKIIGEVKSENPGKVFMRTSIGSTRLLDKPVGEPLPRIC